MKNPKEHTTKLGKATATGKAFPATVHRADGTTETIWLVRTYFRKPSATRVDATGGNHLA